MRVIAQDQLCCFLHKWNFLSKTVLLVFRITSIKLSLGMFYFSKLFVRLPLLPFSIMPLLDVTEINLKQRSPHFPHFVLLEQAEDMYYEIYV